MPPRRRKVVVAPAGQSPEKVKFSTAVIELMLNAQQKESTHGKLVNQLKQLYATVPHDSFMKSFIEVVKRQMEQEEANEYANNVLKFCAKFLAESEHSDQSITHPAMASFFNWLLTTISNVPLIRFRICQQVNLILNALGSDATVDDTICDKILRYMLERLRDVSQQVRVQAVLALQRLQDPTDPEDNVVRAFVYHLDKDPSAKVRQTIISVLGRNKRLIPHILERLWDVDERVRRHTYMQMSSYPVRQYMVTQRLKFLEQGLVDHSDSVRKVVRNVMIPQWIESYQRDYVAFVEALKLDANDHEMDRFRKTAKMALLEIFSKNGVQEMASLLNFSDENKSVPLEELTIERAICWQAMLEYVQRTNSADEEDYMMELSKFCEYLKNVVENPAAAAFTKLAAGNTSTVGTSQASPGGAEVQDKLQQLYFQHILVTLLEIVGMYDFADEFGCDSLKLVLSGILCNETLLEMNVRSIMRTFEKLLPEVETRLKFFVDLINSVLEPSRVDFSHSSRMVVETYLERHPEQTALKLKISALKLEILDLKEQENLLVQQKNYAGAQCVAEKLNTCNEEYANLVKPLVQEMTSSISSTSGDMSSLFCELTLKPRRMTLATINKCLQVCFYLVNSPTVRVLTPAACDLYKSFISRHVQSAELHTRNLALRASTAFSMLYDGLSKDTFQLLYQQFLDTASTRLWKTAIECVFELLDRYGFEHFDLEKDDTERANKSARQLFNRHSTGYSDEPTAAPVCNGNEFYKMSIHFMDTCDDEAICSTIIDGFCRLILHGHCTSLDIVSKLLLRFFNPNTDPETQQILGIFFEALVRKKRQEMLQMALLRTLFAVLEAPNESPLHEVSPEAVVKFVIDSTQPVFCAPGVNPHNAIASTFLRVMQDNLILKDLLKILSRQLLVLDIAEDAALRGELVNTTNALLQEQSLDRKVVTHLTMFREKMLGKIWKALSFSSSRPPVEPVNDDDADADASPSKEASAEDDDDDGEEEEENEEENENEEEEENEQENRRTSPSRDGENSSIKSLRRSLCFSSSPLPVAREPARVDDGTGGGKFKVPDASALRKIRAAPPSRAAQSRVPAKGGGAPRTSEPPRPAAAAAAETTRTNAPQEEAAEESSSSATTSESEDAAPASRGRSSRVAASRRQESKVTRSKQVEPASSSSSSDGEVVNGSPNVTVGRSTNRSVRPLNTVAVTRHVSRLGALDAKVMARKSLDELTAAAPIAPAKRTTAKGGAAPAVPDKQSEQHAATTGRAATRRQKSLPSKDTTKPEQGTKPAKAPASPSLRRTSSRRDGKAASPAPVRQTSPQLPSTPTRTSGRRTTAAAQASPSPGSKRHHARSASGVVSSGDSGTSTKSPIRLKRAAVVLTPLNVAQLQRMKPDGLDGPSSRTTRAQTTSPRRTSRKATQK